MKKMLALVFSSYGLILSPGHAASSNPIIGQWKLAQANCNAMTQIVYTPTEYAGYEIPSAPFPGWTRHGASYVVSKEEVWVKIAGYGTETRVFPIDANHIKPDDGSGCIYERVK